MSQESSTGLFRGKSASVPASPLVSSHFTDLFLAAGFILPHELTAEDRARLRISQLPQLSHVSAHRLGNTRDGERSRSFHPGGMVTLLSALFAALSADNSVTFELAS